MKGTAFLVVAAVCLTGALTSAEELRITSPAFSQNGVVLGTDLKIAGAADLYQAMSGHTLAHAELIGRYKRSLATRALFYGVLAVPVLLIAAVLYWTYRGVRAILRLGTQ
jgi:hypothetical protein